MLDYTLVSTKEEAVRREDVMGKHYQVFTTFQIIKAISPAYGLTEQMLHEANEEIFTFGS
ncbi:BnaC05g47890D [Brassica napus]|uniref:Uncharacterized protein n=2 Tax=Brassica TaxID=3705 RepID=A0A3P5ZVR6_BRACM|nr:unnamed protein product [Brassica napus]CDY50694.1 BnaC05g47890D [Brassica napus]VDC79534.1 unnamed protein product [Brassica rapa]